MALTTLQVVTPPAAEPVTVEQARQALRVDHGADDALLARYITSARSMVEMYLARVLVTQTLLWTMRPTSGLPTAHWTRQWGELVLPRAPVQSVSAVTTLDVWGNLTTIGPAVLPVTPPAPLTGWVADTALQPARLRIGAQTLLTGGAPFWRTDLDNIGVTFVAGYDPAGATVPAPIINAILVATAFLYENRGDAGGELPMAVQWLLDPYRIHFVR